MGCIDVVCFNVCSNVWEFEEKNGLYNNAIRNIKKKIIIIILFEIIYGNILFQFQQ